MRPLPLVLALALPLCAQTPPETDRAAITRTVLDYVEGWYEGDATRMEGALHPDLAKRIVVTDAAGRSRLDHMGALALVQGTRAGYGRSTPRERQEKEVQVLDVTGHAATAKATMADWVDYLHLVRWNGRWKIINVLWERKR